MHRSRVGLVAVMLVSGVLAGATTAPPQRHIEELAWLAGSWADESGGGRVEEHWTAPRGGLMLGMHRDALPGKAAAFEFLRIVETAGRLAYLASPSGQPATRFDLAEIGERRVVFANPEHDFPQRILYWIEPGGRLHARIEGRLKGAPASEDWSWERSTIAPQGAPAPASADARFEAPVGDQPKQRHQGE